MNKHANAVSEWVNRPSLNKLGAFIHAAWHRGGLGMIDRRVLMGRLATELLWRLGDSREIPKDATSVDEQVLEDVFALTQEPKDMQQSLLANALYGALLIFNSKSDLGNAHEAAGRVYYPLMVLEGLLLKQTDVAMRSRVKVTHEMLGRFRAKHMKKQNENARGWQAAAAKEFQVHAKTVSRIWNGK
jgi:hypothetical protein